MVFVFVRKLVPSRVDEVSSLMVKWRINQLGVSEKNNIFMKLKKGTIVNSHPASFVPLFKVHEFYILSQRAHVFIFLKFRSGLLLQCSFLPNFV